MILSIQRSLWKVEMLARGKEMNEYNKSFVGGIYDVYLAS